MLKVLVKKQLMEIFRSYFYNAKKNKAYSKGATAAYVVLFVMLMVGVLGGIFTGMALMICKPMAEAEVEWFYFALMGLTAILLGAFGSVFNTFSSLYLSKDNDLLLSLPIQVSVIMISRLMSVYLMGLMYSGAVTLPAVIVYWVTVEFSVKAVAGGILYLVLISIFVMTLSCALGWIVAKISLRLKHKSFITVIISLAFFGGYYFISFQAQRLISELLANAVVYGMQVKSFAYPVYLLGMSGTGDLGALFVVMAAVLVLFAVMWLLMSKSFLKIATSTGKTEHKVYREKTVKCKSIPTALLGREVLHFTSSPNYMLNCGLGIILLPVAGIAFLVKGKDLCMILNQIFGDRPGSVMLILCAALCALASMNDMSAPSVSLEGKNLWLIQSLPITPWQVLRAKLLLHAGLTGIPMLFCVICMAVTGICPWEQLLLSFVLCLGYVLLMALSGLFLGLKMPNLNWTSELAPIKQSACVAVNLFGGFLYTLLFAAGYLMTDLWKMGFAGYTGIFTGITFLLCLVLYRWLKKKGSQILAEL